MPADLVGQPYGSACAELSATGLACSPTYLPNAAPAGQEGQVVGARPSRGSLPAHSTVVLDVDEVAVPPPTAGETYSSYCATINMFFTCQPSDQGQGPTTATPDAVTAESPGAGTLEPPDPRLTTVTVDYYSSSTQPPPGSPVPDCSAMSSTQCSQAVSAVNLVPVLSAQTSPNYGCNQVSGSTSPPAGQVVDQGTGVTIPYNTYCAVPRYEWHQTDAVHDANIYYLGSQAPAYASWSQVAGVGYGYPVLNNACPKPGTAPVYQFVYPATKGVNSWAHYYYSFDPNWYLSNNGWDSGVLVDCEFPSAGPNETAVYFQVLGSSPYTSNHQPYDYFWTSASGTFAWYRPDSP